MGKRLVANRLTARSECTLPGALLLFFLLGTTAAGSEISLEQSISSTTIPYEDSVVLDIKLEWSGSQFRYRFPAPLSPDADRLKVKGYSSSVSSSGADSTERTIKQFRLVFVPTSSGAASIAAVTIPYLLWPDSIPGEVTTQPLSINIAEAQARKVDSESQFPMTYLLLALVPLGIGSVLLYRRMRTRSVTPVHKPEDAFLEGLEKIKAEAMGDFKKYQSGVFALLATYFRARFALTSESLETDDPLKDVPEKLMGAADRTQLSHWFVRARADRFRPVAPEPGELLRLDAELRSVFNRLKS